MNTDALLEILIEKALASQKNMEEVKILIRELPNYSDAFSRVHERISATQAAVREGAQTISSAGQEIESVKTTVGSVLETEIKTAARIDDLSGQLKATKDSIEQLKAGLTETISGWLFSIVVILVVNILIHLFWH